VKISRLGPLPLSPPQPPTLFVESLCGRLAKH
jgi:hypothetical protein